MLLREMRLIWEIHLRGSGKGVGVEVVEEYGGGKGGVTRHGQEFCEKRRLEHTNLRESLASAFSASERSLFFFSFVFLNWIVLDFWS